MIKLKVKQGTGAGGACVCGEGVVEIADRVGREAWESGVGIKT